MEVVPLTTAEQVAALAADVVEAQARRTPAAVLGLATGLDPAADLPGADPPPPGRRGPVL
nr:hypothetical protein [Pseudofrankia sp. DC12]